jgi:hypothetical protein
MGIYVRTSADSGEPHRDTNIHTNTNINTNTNTNAHTN